ncbi:MAG: glutaredoxin family protein [Desulfitobacterium sp.]
MKPVTMFVLESCPYCKEALRWMEELKAENAHYERVEFTIVDEQLQPEIARQYPYYYVPTYFVDGIKVHEGAATKDIVRNVFDKALEH